MKRFLLIAMLSFVGLWSCITEDKDFMQINSESFLTIEASLSDQEGPHRVYVGYSSPNIKINVENTPIESAIVSFSDDKGNKENLTEIEDGIYETSRYFKGIVGNTYTLKISLPDGRNYFSSPEKLIASPKIDDVKAEFVVKTNFDETDSRSLGYDVTLDFTDPPEPNQYYQWQWVNYQRTVYCATCTKGYDFYLKKCNTEINFYEGQNEVEIINYRCGEMICDTCPESCFDITRNTTYNLLSDNLLNGQKIINIPIARVPYDDRSLYYLRIEQKAISKKMYQYLRSIKDVTQSSGTLFDIPAETQFSPNLYSKENPNEKILGAFEVYGLQRKTIYVERNIGSEAYIPFKISYVGRSIVLRSPKISPKAVCVEGKYRTKIEPKDFKE